MTQNLHTSITKRQVKQKNREGKIFLYDRYQLHYRDPITNRRLTKRFKTRKNAVEAQNALIADVTQGTHRFSKRDLTVAEAVAHWLESTKDRVGPTTWKFYTQAATWIVGPVLVGTKTQRCNLKNTGKMPKGTRMENMIGHVKLSELTTAQIRVWNQRVETINTAYMAETAKKHLKTALDLTAEDYNVLVPKMPRRIGQGRRKFIREILTPEQVGQIIEYGQHDPRWGLYYVFPLMTGTRPSEQLGLLWQDVDLERGYIHIRRTQNQDGTIKEALKTDAGNRMIPLAPALRTMLAEWRNRCPRLDGQLHRVFPAQGHKTNPFSAPAKAGGPLLIFNYRNRVWYDVLKKLGLPQVAPYSARHMMISNLQAQGVDVATVAKIAGHANPNITMQYYTHAVGKLDGVMDKLGTAYGIQ